MFYNKTLQKSKQQKSDKQQDISLQVGRYLYVDAIPKIDKNVKGENQWRTGIKYFINKMYCVLELFQIQNI